MARPLVVNALELLRRPGSQKEISLDVTAVDVGLDTGAPVGPYPHVYPCTARIRTVTLERLSDLSPADRRTLAEREFRASVSSQ